MAKLKISKRDLNSYKAYKKRYRKTARRMKRRGMEMNSTMMDERSYLMTKRAYKEAGFQKNFNAKIVSEQQYAYSRSTAQRFKKTAEELDLEWKDVSHTKLRYGDIDVSGINEFLKENNPDMTGAERAEYISENIFGSL